MRYPKLAFALLAFSATLVAAEPFAGTWKLNVAKSKYKTGAPNKEGTIAITESGSDLDVSTTATSADGASISAHYTVPAKGGEGKIISGPWEAVSAKRPGPPLAIRCARPRAAAPGSSIRAPAAAHPSRTPIS